MGQVLDVKLPVTESLFASALSRACLLVLPLSMVGDLDHCATLSAPDFITTCEVVERTCFFVSL